MSSVEAVGPVTQTVEAVKSLIGKGSVADLPEFYRLSDDVVFVLSANKDSYYVVTPRGCSCPAKTYHPSDRCKHMRRFFPQGAERRQWSDGTVIQGRARPHVAFRPVLEEGV
jgi:hypothetical protein